MYGLLRFVPKNHFSYLFGFLARVPLSPRLRSLVYRWFARRYGVDLSESERPPEEYRSLADFFTRNLRAGARRIEEGIVSPVDGTIVSCGAVTGDVLIQAKGKTFTLARLLGNNVLAASFQNGFYLTIYLAPGDYHHIHSPVDGSIAACYYIAGKLWPVNSWSVENVNELFCVNERVTTLLSSSHGRVAVVKVGATNVGAIRVDYDQLQANAPRRLIGGVPPIEIRRYDPAKPCARGERLGTFCLGSTVIVLFEPDRFHPGEKACPGKIRLGERLNAAGAK